MKNAAWINRKQQLPAESGAVLAYFDSFGSGMTNCVVTWFTAENGRFDADDDFRAVTHWMALPAAPEGN